MISPKARTLITFIGCSILHLVNPIQVIGTIYSTGSIMPYISSYIGYKTGYVSMTSMNIVFYICVFSWSFSFQPTLYLQSKLGSKRLICLGSFLYVSVVFIASVLTSRIPIIIIYGVVLGFSSGLAYIPSLITAIHCYPTHRGMVVGIVVGCFAFGSFIFNFVATSIVNPENKKPTLEKSIDGVKVKFFEEDIAKRVPMMFWILGSIYACIVCCALIMIENVDLSVANGTAETNASSELKDGQMGKTVQDKEVIEMNSERGINSSENLEENGSERVEIRVEEAEEKVPEEEMTYLKAIKTRNFYLIFVTTMLAGTAGMFSIASFKVIGLEYGFEDTFLTVVGSLGSAMNGSNRPFWGILFDKGYRYTYMFICFMVMVVCFTFPFVSQYKPAFLIWLCMLYSSSGATITQLAPISVKLFGKKIGFRIYTLLFLSVGCASMTVFFVQNYIAVYLSSDILFYMLGGMAAVAFVTICFFRLEK